MCEKVGDVREALQCSHSARLKEPRARAAFPRHHFYLTKGLTDTLLNVWRMFPTLNTGAGHSLPGNAGPVVNGDITASE